MFAVTVEIVVNVQVSKDLQQKTANRLKLLAVFVMLFADRVNCC